MCINGLIFPENLIFVADPSPPPKPINFDGSIILALLVLKSIEFMDW